LIELGLLVDSCPGCQVPTKWKLSVDEIDDVTVRFAIACVKRGFSREYSLPIAELRDIAVNMHG
jgi:hypothetical protein